MRGKGTEIRKQEKLLVFTSKIVLYVEIIKDTIAKLVTLTKKIKLVSGRKKISTHIENKLCFYMKMTKRK